MQQQQQQQQQKSIDFSKYHRLHVCLRIAYDGSPYDGLAIQDHTPNTIEEVLLRACVKLRLIPDLFVERANKNKNSNDAKNPNEDNDENKCNSNKTSTSSSSSSSSISDWIKFSRCGRTDKGVNAMGNAVSLFMRGAPKKTNSDGTTSAADDDASSTMPPPPLYDKLLNKVLPTSIRVIGYCVINYNNNTRPSSSSLSSSSLFDARFSCQARSYRYFFDAYRLNLSKMVEAAKLLEGKHDFRNLCQMDVVAVSNFVREVMSAKIRDASTDEEVKKDAPCCDHHRMCYLDIRATAFLYHQIRCIMTILLSVAAEAEQPQIVTELLDVAKNPRKPVYPLADPAPLVLWNCEYSKEDIPKWTCDEATVKQQYLQELEMETNSARVKVAACTSMKNMMLREMTMTMTTKNTPNEEKETTTSSLTSTTAFLFKNFSGKSSNNNSTNCITNYIPLWKRDKEKTFEDKVASLSDKRKDRMFVNTNLKKTESGTRRERGE